MKKYVVQATVNYPETDVLIPDFEVNGIYGAVLWLEKLMASEPEATSYLITIAPVNRQEPEQAQ